MNEMAEMQKGVQHYINIIKRSIKAYVFEEDDSMYRIVATEMRKLLLDTNAAASFTKDKKNKMSLFELFYGNGKNILLQSFLEILKGEQRTESNNRVPVTPTIYFSRSDILCEAMYDDNLVSLPKWIEEPFVYDNFLGTVQTPRMILNYMAGKEGSHIINPKKTDIRKGPQMALTDRIPTSSELPDFPNHWAQFIIDAGMRLLNARRASDKKFLIKHDIVVLKRRGRRGKILKKHK